jgi:hypothetical protein
MRHAITPPCRRHAAADAAAAPPLISHAAASHAAAPPLRFAR